MSLSNTLQISSTAENRNKQRQHPPANPKGDKIVKDNVPTTQNTVSKDRGNLSSMPSMRVPLANQMINAEPIISLQDKVHQASLTLSMLIRRWINLYTNNINPSEVEKNKIIKETNEACKELGTALVQDSDYSGNPKKRQEGIAIYLKLAALLNPATYPALNSIVPFIGKTITPRDTKKTNAPKERNFLPDLTQNLIEIGLSKNAINLLTQIISAQKEPHLFEQNLNTLIDILTTNNDFCDDQLKEFNDAFKKIIRKIHPDKYITKTNIEAATELTQFFNLKRAEINEIQARQAIIKQQQTLAKFVVSLIIQKNNPSFAENDLNEMLNLFSNIFANLSNYAEAYPQKKDFLNMQLDLSTRHLKIILNNKALLKNSIDGCPKDTTTQLTNLNNQLKNDRHIETSDLEKWLNQYLVSLNPAIIEQSDKDPFLDAKESLILPLFPPKKYRETDKEMHQKSPKLYKAFREKIWAHIDTVEKELQSCREKGAFSSTLFNKIMAVNTELREIIKSNEYGLHKSDRKKFNTHVRKITAEWLSRSVEYIADLNSEKTTKTKEEKINLVKKLHTTLRNNLLKNNEPNGNKLAKRQARLKTAVYKQLTPITQQHLGFSIRQIMKKSASKFVAS